MDGGSEIVIKLQRIFLALFAFGSTIALSGCKFAVLDPKGIIAADEKRLLLIAVGLMLIVVIPAIAMTFMFAWKFRASNTKAKYTPDKAHNNALEAVVWGVPCLIIAILATLTWFSSHKLDPYRPLDVAAKPITIQAIALDWKWLFIYPDQKIATVNYLQIPINAPVLFLVTADAPMNSLAIPQLSGQIYAMAGMQTKLNIMANAAGEYRGLSTNFSGDGFSGMRFKVKAGTQQEFEDWVNEVKKSPKMLTMETYNKLAQPSENSPVEYFTVPEQGLYNNIIMKYMMPMENMSENASQHEHHHS